MRKTTLICLAITLLHVACDRQAAPRPSETATQPAAAEVQRTVTFLAAASTTNAAQEVAAAFSKETGIEVKLSPGASNALASQILAGAPADVYLSASEQWANAVVDAGRALESKHLLANTLVIVVPQGNPANVHGPDDLLKPDVKHVALAGERVPAGKYAGQSLQAAGVYEKLMQDGKIVRAEDVRFTLSYADRGEVEAAVVYATDAPIATHVEIAYTFDAASHDPIVYPVVLLKTDKPNDAGRRFYEFLQTPEAMAIFAKYGFAPASAPTSTR